MLFWMDVSFADAGLDRLETDPQHDAGFNQAIVRAFRQRMQAIRAADDERTFYALKSWRFEKLKGKRSHQRSIRLNDQWRLLIEIRKGKPKNTVVIVSIEDYHRG
jgi:proteic killer suppression protein